MNEEEVFSGDITARIPRVIKSHCFPEDVACIAAGAAANEATAAAGLPDKIKRNRSVSGFRRLRRSATCEVDLAVNRCCSLVRQLELARAWIRSSRIPRRVRRERSIGPL